MARTQELNRSHKAVTAMKATHNRLIKVLEKEIEWVNTKLTKAVVRSPSGKGFTKFSALSQVWAMVWPIH